MGNEILMVVDAVSREKGVEREIIFQALEAALATATRKRYKQDVEIRVSIDRQSGDYEAFRRWLVMDDDAEDFEFPDHPLLLNAASARNADEL